VKTCDDKTCRDSQYHIAESIFWLLVVFKRAKDPSGSTLHYTPIDNQLFASLEKEK